MLVNNAIAMNRLESGVLVRPFGEHHVLASPMTHDLLVPSTGETPSAVARFTDWLLSEATAFQQDMTGKAY